jgi:hypothetical protein
VPFQPPGALVIVLVVVLEKRWLEFLARAIAHRLEGSQTSLRRPKLRKATSGKPLYPDAPGLSLSDVAFKQSNSAVPASIPAYQWRYGQGLSRASVDSSWQLYRLAAGGSRERL